MIPPQVGCSILIFSVGVVVWGERPHTFYRRMSDAQDLNEMLAAMGGGGGGGGGGGQPDLAAMMAAMMGGQAPNDGPDLSALMGGLMGGGGGGGLDIAALMGAMGPGLSDMMGGMDLGSEMDDIMNWAKGEGLQEYKNHDILGSCVCMEIYEYVCVCVCVCINDFLLRTHIYSIQVP
jgi:hypothetical protein